MEVTAITGTTLDDIIYSYGGEEDVEGFCGLILNKADLKAFAKLRTDDGKKVYDIKNNGNSGTIDGVPFIINSACKAVSAPGTTKGEYCMAYGPFFNYELAVFLTWMCQSQLSTNLNQDRLHTRLKCMWAVIRHHTTALFV